MTFIDQKRVAVLGSSGYTLNQPLRSLAESLDIAGANTGNFVFQHAVCKVIGDSAEVITIGLGEDRLHDNPLETIAGCDLVVMPAANHLRADADWTGFNAFLARIDKPMIVLGLGAQADKSGDVQRTAATLRENATVLRMCEILAAKSVFVGVRGEFSRAVASALGIASAEVIGCPSVLISETVDLGARLQERLEFLRQQPERARFCMVAETPYNICNSASKLATEQALLRFAQELDAPYIQQSGGEPTLWSAVGITPPQLEEKIRWLQPRLAPWLAPADLEAYLRRRGRVFFSALDWMDFLKRRDVCIGHRFHGNMAAVGADRLGVVVTHDSRTSELVEHMAIPSISSEDLRASRPTRASVLRQIAFDGARFDHQRRQIAARWRSVFAPRGIALSPYVHALAAASERPATPHATP